MSSGEERKSKYTDSRLSEISDGNQPKSRSSDQSGGITANVINAGIVTGRDTFIGLAKSRFKWLWLLGLLAIVFGVIATGIAIYESQTVKQLLAKAPSIYHEWGYQRTPWINWQENSKRELGFCSIIHKLPLRIINLNKFPIAINSIEIDWGTFQLDPAIPVVKEFNEVVRESNRSIPLTGQLIGECRYPKIYENGEPQIGMRFPLVLESQQRLFIEITCYLYPWESIKDNLLTVKDDDESRESISKIIPLLFDQPDPGIVHIKSLSEHDGRSAPGAYKKNPKFTFNTDIGKLERSVEISLIFTGTLIWVPPRLYYEGKGRQLSYPKSMEDKLVKDPAQAHLDYRKTEN